MDASAIDAIRDLAVLAADKARLDTDAPAVLVGDKVITLEHLQGSRSRFRGRMETDSTEDFLRYVAAQAGEGLAPQVFVEAAALGATAFFNLGTAEDPGHGDHTARLGLRATAAFDALRQAAGQRFDQKGLIDWLEDWSAFLTVTGDGQSLNTAIAAIRRMIIKATSEITSETRSLGATRSALEEIEARGAQQIPDGFTFTCEPYLGLPAITAELRLSVLTGGDKPALVLRWVRREDQQEAIAKTFRSLIASGLPAGTPAYIGTFKP